MPKVYKELGEKVRIYRKAKNYSTAELAKKLDVSAGLVNNIDSVKLLKYSNDDFADNLIGVINEIKQKHSTVKPDDIAIIAIDRGNYYFDLMNYISVQKSNNFGWATNKLHDSKEIKKNQITFL